MNQMTVCTVVNVVEAPVVKAQTRYWILNGEKIPVSNQVHNCLRNGKAKMYHMENQEKERSAYSLQNLEGVDGLEEKSMEEFYRNENIEIARLILEEAFKQLTSREIYLINAIYFERYDISEIAMSEQTYQNKIRREVNKSLVHMKEILGQMDIYKMSDVM